MPSWMGLNFQDSSSLFMGELSVLHDHIIVVMVGIIVVIVYIMFYLLLSKKFYKNFSEGTFIETVWSVVPAFLLLILVLPSMKVLYFMEDVKSPFFTFKVVGHQWYWSYVVPLFKNFSYSVKDFVFSFFEYDSMMEVQGESSSESELGPRLLMCSSSLVIPLGVVSRVLVTSADVIHSFAVPSLGLKVDALPGRVNQLFVIPSRLGVFFGQCSEICGSNHSFMPISIKVVDMEEFDSVSKGYLLDILEEEVGSGVIV